MKFCERCHVSVSGSFSKCPLCQNSLADGKDESPDTFPVIETIYHTHSMFFKALLFTLLAAVIISTMFDIMMPQSRFWSLWVDLGAICIWLGVVTAIKRKGAIHRKLVDMALLSSALAIVWDFFTGWHRWSIDYVLPCVFICCMLIAVILAVVMKMSAQRFAFYILILALLGFLPAISLAAGWNRQRIPSFVSITVSLLVLAAMIIFQRPTTQNELRKRLHF